MIELAQLFQDMEAAVVQQEAAVENIEVKAEDTVTNVDHGRKEMQKAVDHARAARKKKWICLGIFSECIAEKIPRTTNVYSPHRSYSGSCDRRGSLVVHQRQEEQLNYAFMNRHLQPLTWTSIPVSFVQKRVMADTFLLCHLITNILPGQWDTLPAIILSWGTIARRGAFCPIRLRESEGAFGEEHHHHL